MPQGLSVDDFALRRGRTYGTILVDLERHHVVDLLPGRTASALASWLVAHPGPEIIIRDRDGEYRQVASAGAPSARHVANRFHLLGNLRDVMRRIFNRHAPRLAQIPAPGHAHQPLTRHRQDSDASRERTCAGMQAMFDRIHALAAQGLTKSAIGRTLGMHRHTVQKYLALETPPERRHVSHKTGILTPYAGYILERWRHGSHNARQLWREIAAEGYPGSYQNVARLMGELRRHERRGEPWPHAPPGLTAAQAVRCLETFTRLLRARPVKDARQRLEQWMEESEAAESPELTSFMTKLRQDAEAVAAALELPFSQGQTEGQINRLKLVKRAMYGRAKFDLLRQRILYATAS
jgi:transposase